MKLSSFTHENTHSNRILIIDDDPVIRSLLTRILSLDGYIVESHRSAEDSLLTLRTGTYSAIILDLELPGMSGVDFLNQYPELLEKLAIIILTAHGSLDSAIQAIRLKVSDYLLKPIKRDDVIKSIKKAIHEKERELGSDDNHFFLDKDGMGLGKNEINPYDEIFINLNKRVIVKNGFSIKLTNNEARILETLIQNEHEVVTHSELVKATQGYSLSMVDAAKILRPVICRLNEKLRRIGIKDRWIQNIRGTGYLLEFPKENRS